MSSSNCCFLTCIQISQEAGQVVMYSHLFKNFPVCYENFILKIICVLYVYTYPIIIPKLRLWNIIKISSATSYSLSINLLTLYHVRSFSGMYEQTVLYFAEIKLPEDNFMRVIRVYWHCDFTPNFLSKRHWKHRRVMHLNNIPSFLNGKSRPTCS